MKSCKSKDRKYHGQKKKGKKKRQTMILKILYSICTRPTRLVRFFIVLAHWNNSPRIDMSFHSHTFSLFRANQFVLLPLNAVCLAEKQQIPILVFGLTGSGLEPTIYHTRGKHLNYNI